VTEGQRFQGRVALVTGGATGLGAATAELLLEQGASVMITGRDAERGGDAVARLSGRGPIAFTQSDARSPEAVEESVRLTEEKFGPLDLLVTSAGVGVVSSLAETSEADWRWTWETNVSGSLYAAQAAIRAMRHAGRPGAIVLISSDAGLVGERSIGAYSVSKAAVVMMTKVLALDGAPDGIRVNCVCPGYFEPGMLHVPDRSVQPTGEDGAGYVDPPKPPLGRHGSARVVAEAVLYLAGPESSFCTGSVLLVDGGATAGIP
jgi:meso-butanediol dehydrogenase / (S,S)-butanediol dehydrogenase / diacetyl reductase